MARLQVELPDDQVARLKSRAHQREMSMTRLIGLLIDQELSSSVATGALVRGLMLKEAQASVALDHDPDMGTHSVGDGHDHVIEEEEEPDVDFGLDIGHPRPAPKPRPVKPRRARG